MADLSKLIDLAGLSHAYNKLLTLINQKAGTSAATQSAAGLMSAADKKKLDGVATGANAYTHPTTSGNKHIPSGGSSGQILKWSADGTATWGAAPSVTVDSSLSSTSTNPVQNKVINTALAGKASTAAATTSAAGLMSASDKSKLDGIATGANKTTVDSALSSSSTNPVQNKVINTALGGKLSTGGGTMTGNLAFDKADGSVIELDISGAGIAITNTSSNENNRAKLRLNRYDEASSASLVQVEYFNDDLGIGGTYNLYGSFNTHNHSTADITSGVLPVARGGTGVTSLASLATALGAAKIQTGTYTGAGKYGETNALSLTFNFVPKLVIVQTGSATATADCYGLTIYAAALTTEYTNYAFTTNGLQNNNVSSNKAKLVGTTLSWFATNPSYMANNNGYVFHYVAIG